MTHDNGSSSTPSVTGGKLDDAAAHMMTIDRSAVGTVEAEQAQLEQAAVRRLRATQATIDHSAVFVARLDQATVNDSNVALLAARNVEAEKVHTMVLVSPVVKGEVHTLLDMRSAVAIGVGMALGSAVLAAVRAMARRATS